MNPIIYCRQTVMLFVRIDLFLPCPMVKNFVCIIVIELQMVTTSLLYTRKHEAMTLVLANLNFKIFVGINCLVATFEALLLGIFKNLAITATINKDQHTNYNPCAFEIYQEHRFTMNCGKQLSCSDIHVEQQFLTAYVPRNMIQIYQMQSILQIA